MVNEELVNKTIIGVLIKQIVENIAYWNNKYF